MNRQRTLRVLLGVRQRRAQVFDDAVAQAARQRDEAAAAEQAAGDQLASAQGREQTARDKLSALTEPGQTFDTTGLMARQHLVEVMQGNAIEASAERERCTRASLSSVEMLLGRRADAARNRQKINGLCADLATLAREARQRDDDTQDEEAEEAAISRMLAAVRPLPR